MGKGNKANCTNVASYSPQICSTDNQKIMVGFFSDYLDFSIQS